MPGRGGLVALSSEQRDRLFAATTDDEKIDLVLEFIGLAREADHVETDKAWEGIHRALAREDPEGDEFPPGESDDPLTQVILGGAPLLEDETEFVMRLVEAEQIAAIAAAMQAIDEPAFRTLYDTYCRPAGDVFNDENWDYYCEWFRRVKLFYLRIAEHPRTVIFSVDP